MSIVYLSLDGHTWLYMTVLYVCQIKSLAPKDRNVVSLYFPSVISSSRILNKQFAVDLRCHAVHTISLGALLKHYFVPDGLNYWWLQGCSSSDNGGGWWKCLLQNVIMGDIKYLWNDWLTFEGLRIDLVMIENMIPQPQLSRVNMQSRIIW